MAVFAAAVWHCSLGATSYGSLQSRVLLRHIGPPSHCRDRRSRRSPHGGAMRAQSELRAVHASSAAAATPAVPATSLQCLRCGLLSSLHVFFTGIRPGAGFVFVMFTGFGFIVRFPMLRQAQQLSRRHLDQREHLPTLSDQHVVLWTCDAECAPDPRALYLV